MKADLLHLHVLHLPTDFGEIMKYVCALCTYVLGYAIHDAVVETYLQRNNTPGELVVGYVVGRTRLFEMMPG